MQKCKKIKEYPCRGSKTDLEIRLNKISRRHGSKEVYITTFPRSWCEHQLLKWNNRIYSNDLSFGSLRKGEVMKIKPSNIPIY